MADAAAGIYSQMTEAKRARDAANKALEQQYTRGLRDTKNIHWQVGAFLNNQNDAISQGYTQAGQKIGGLNGSLLEALRSNTSRNAGEASGELQRLGIGRTGLGNLFGDANFAQMQAIQSAENDQTNNRFARQNAMAIGELLRGMNKGQRTSVQGNLLQTRNDAVAKNNTNFAEYYQDALKQIRQARLQAAAAANSYRKGSGGGGSDSEAKDTYDLLKATDTKKTNKPGGLHTTKPNIFQVMGLQAWEPLD